jgi:hypothetical protein
MRIILIVLILLFSCAPIAQKTIVKSYGRTTVFYHPKSCDTLFNIEYDGCNEIGCCDESIKKVIPDCDCIKCVDTSKCKNN